MLGKKVDICVAFSLFVDDRVNIREAIIVEAVRISGSASLVQLTGASEFEGGAALGSGRFMAQDHGKRRGLCLYVRTSVETGRGRRGGIVWRS